MIDKKLFNKILTMAFISTTGTAMVSGGLINNQYNAVAETTNTSKEPAPNTYINSINNAFSVDHVLSNSENYTQEEKDNATFSNIMIKTLDENSVIKNNTFQTVEEAKEFLKDKTDKDFPAKITDPVSYLIDISGNQSIIKLSILENIDSNSTDSFFIKAEKSGEQTFTIDELTNGKYKAEDGWKISKFNDADVFDIETGAPLSSITINLDKNEVLNYRLTVIKEQCNSVYDWGWNIKSHSETMKCFESLNIDPKVLFYKKDMYLPGEYTPTASEENPIDIGLVSDVGIKELKSFAAEVLREEGQKYNALENGVFKESLIKDKNILENIQKTTWEKINNKFIELSNEGVIYNKKLYKEGAYLSENPDEIPEENKNGIYTESGLINISSYDKEDAVWIPTYEVEGNIFNKQEEITPTTSETPSSETPTNSETTSSETPTTSETTSSETPTTSETPTSSETPSSETPTTSDNPSSETPTTIDDPSSDTPIVKEPTNTTTNTTETITTTKNNTPIVQTRVINSNGIPQTNTITNNPSNDSITSDIGIKVDTGGKNVETIFGKIREVFR